MPRLVHFSPDQVVRMQGTATVYTRDRLSDVDDPDAPWAIEPYVICEECEFSIGGAIGMARFRHHYGKIKQRGSNAFTYVRPVTLVDKYVKIEIEESFLTVEDANDRNELEGVQYGTIIRQLSPPGLFQFIGKPGSETNANAWLKLDLSTIATWHGIITNESRTHYGAETGGIAGDQMFLAQSLDVLMTRKQIVTSRFRDDTQEPARSVTIPRGLTFNGTTSAYHLNPEYGVGNRHPEYTQFASTLKDAELWTSQNIVQYVMVNLDPYNGQVSAFETNELRDALAGVIPVNVATHGRTTFDVINDVIDRRRGIGWRSWLNEEIGLVKLELVPFSDVEIDIGDLTLPANKNVLTLDISNVPGMVCVEAEDALRAYKGVVVEGGLQGAVFSVSVVDGSLEPDWSPTDVQQYWDAAKSRPNYATYDRSYKCSINDSERMSEQLRHVFTRLRVPDAWDYRVLNGEGGGAFRYVFPRLPEAGDPDDIAGVPQPVWRPGFRFQPKLPLKIRHDYTTGSLSNDNNPAGSTPELLQPFAIMPMSYAGGPESWHFANSASAAMAADELQGDGGSALSARISVHDYQAGVSATPSGVPHLMQKQVYYDGLGGPNSPEPSHVHIGEVDYDRVIFTMYATCDAPITSSYPENPQLGNGVGATMTIRLGDRKRVDYMPAGTVVGIKDGQPARTEAAQFLRDDRHSLKQIARSSYEWYSRARTSVRLSIAKILTQIQIGDYLKYLKVDSPTTVITREGLAILTQERDAPAVAAAVLVTRDGKQIMTRDGRMVTMRSDAAAGNGKRYRIAIRNANGEPVELRPINTVVSNVHYNFTNGTTTISTQYAELDHAAFAGEPR